MSPTGDADLRKSLVRLNAAGQRGTGFVIHQAEAGTYILTCRHVVCSKDDQPLSVLAAGQFKTTPLYNAGPRETEADVAVLLCEAKDLRNCPALTLGEPLAPREYKIFSFKTTTFPDGKDGEETVIGWYQLSDSLSLKSRLLSLRNDDIYRISPGDSGSPVFDGETGLAIAVVTRVGTTLVNRNRDESDALIGATPVSALTKWTGKPPGLVIHSPQLPSPIGRSVNDLVVGRQLRILVAAPKGLENEVAIVRETVERTSHAPGARNFPVQLDRWDAGWDDRRLADFHGVILIASKNDDPADETGLLTLEAKTRDSGVDSQQRTERRLIYHLRDDSFDGPSVFADGLKKDALPYVACSSEMFPDRFWDDYQKMFPYLIDWAANPQAGPAQAAVLGAAPATRIQPYRGLKSYGVDDATLFHGRSHEVTELRNRLAASADGILPVVGPSGCGKSSVVRAGLFYRLGLDAIAGSSGWKRIDLRLSEPSKETGDLLEPLLQLALKLNDAIPAESRYASAKEVQRRFESPEGLTEITRRVCGADPAARMILFVDQFEEIFTMFSENQRVAFLARLREFALQSSVRVIFTMRDDFYGKLQETPLSKLPDLQQPFWLKPAEIPSVFKAISLPAALCGYRFESADLVLRILRDGGSGAGALPLISYALESLVTVSNGFDLTWAGYGRIGGVEGVIQKQAEQAVRGVAAQTIERLFRRLIAVDERGTATKTPARFDPRDSSWTAEEIALKDALVNARLLVTGKDTLEIAHEALLSHWPYLKEWIERSREALLLMQNVRNSAYGWQRERDRAAESGLAPEVLEPRLRDIDRELYWPQERLTKVREAMQLLALSESDLTEETRIFVRDERDRILDELQQHGLKHERRAEIGERLAELGDPRAGVGLRGEIPNQVPDIAWSRVPAGLVTLHIEKDAERQAEVKPFFFSRYPVTMAQFDRFAMPAVYFQPEWWVGLAVKPENQPVIVQKPGTSNHPAQFVSWYQAVAFTRWLSRALGYAVRLPTEWEWVQAATGGHADFVYPWGPKWDLDRANHRGTAYKLMSVGMYPEGKSPVGAYDMSGNMYEWCLNKFDSLDGADLAGTEPRTTKGGAWFSTPDQLEVQHRLRDNADGTNSANRRIGVCIRLVAEDVPGLRHSP